MTKKKPEATGNAAVDAFNTRHHGKLSPAEQASADAEASTEIPVTRFKASDEPPSTEALEAVFGDAVRVGLDPSVFGQDPLDVAPEHRQTFGRSDWLLLYREGEAGAAAWVWPMDGHGLVIRVEAQDGDDDIFVMPGASLTELVDDKGRVVDRWIAKDTKAGCVQATTKNTRPPSRTVTANKLFRTAT